MNKLYVSLEDALYKINVKEKEAIILTKKEPYNCYMFAMYIAGADKQALSKVVLESLGEYWIKTFYKFIDFDKTEYDKYLIFM